MRRTLRPGIALGVLLLIVTACGSDSSLERWEEDWRALLDDLPALETLLVATEDEAMELCGDALATLRSAAPELQEAPDPDLAAASTRYLEFAESVYFECPIRTSEHAGFEAGYAEMDHLRSAVEALLTDSR